jgi:hypothetical protein
MNPDQAQGRRLILVLVGAVILIVLALVAARLCGEPRADGELSWWPSPQELAPSPDAAKNKDKADAPVPATETQAESPPPSPGPQSDSVPNTAIVPDPAELELTILAGASGALPADVEVIFQVISSVPKVKGVAFGDLREIDLSAQIRRHRAQRFDNTNPLTVVDEKRHRKNCAHGDSLVFQSPVSGDHLVLVRSAGRVARGQGVVVLTLGKRTQLSVTLVPMPVIRGRVIDAEGQAIAGAMLSAQVAQQPLEGEVVDSAGRGAALSHVRDQGRATAMARATGETDDLGLFRIECPWTGTVTLDVSHDDHGSAIVRREAIDGFAALEIDVRLGDPSLKRKVMVQDAEGAPAALKKFRLRATEFGPAILDAYLMTDTEGLLADLPQLDRRTYWLFDWRSKRAYPLHPEPTTTIRLAAP